jgi:hypothetical protein
MKLTSGEIYFIGEYDLKTGERTEYVKVGIVRHGGKDERSSLDRLLEHQTGNPRRLEIIHTITTDAVEGIETNLHHSFSMLRVYGEWLKLDEVQIEKVKTRAEELRDQMESLRPLFEKAEELKKVPSKEGKIPSDGVSEHWYRLYQNAKVKSDACDEVIDAYKSLRIKEKEEGKEVDQFIGVQVRAGRKYFDEKAFKEANPEIYAQFLKEETSKEPKGSFRISPQKSGGLELVDIDADLAKLINEFAEEIAKPAKSRKESELHNLFLHVNSALAFAEWEQDVAVVQIKVLCDSSEGISGICSWKRAHTTTEIFDMQGLKDQFPDLVEKFMRETEATKAYSLETKSAYKDE